jgi:dephospho-CoA kinase
MNHIIALVGMCGAGKSVVSDFYKEQGYEYIYFGAITMEEILNRGLEINEKNEKKVREQLRKTHGMAAYALLNLIKIDKALKKGNVIVDGLYSWAEYKVLKEKFGERLKILAIFTPRNVRYDRLSQREHRPLNSVDAEKRDFSEIENIEKGGPIAMADYTVVNDGTVEDLVGKLEGIF